jgi:hypothetical protein
MSGPSLEDASNSGGFELLGELFPDPPSAQMLLSRLGVAMTRLPPFGTPDIGRWWWQVGRKIDLGHFAAVGLPELFRAAVAEVPENAALARLAGRSWPIVVQFLLANPEAHGRNRLDVDVREVEAVSREFPGRLDIRVSHATRLQDLIRVLAGGGIDIIHFAGHGTPDGQLILDGPAGGRPIDLGDFAGLIKAAGYPRCVVFSSCFSGVYLPLLRGGAEYVVGSEEALSDKSAVHFSAAFYRCLAGDRPVPDAVSFAAAAMKIAGCASPMRIWGGTG